MDDVVRGLIRFLANSEVSAEELIEVCCEETGVKVSKVQLKYAQERDEQMKEAKNIIKKWRTGAEGKVYTKDDIPDFVRESIKSNGKDFDAELDSLGKHAIRAGSEDFCFAGGKLCFNVDGIKYMIACARDLGWVDKKTKIRWMRETGLYTTLEGTALMRED